jgi:hypothetical protein
MATDPKTLAWARTYQQLLAGLTGGAEISPARKALCDALAVIQTELTVMASRFASNGGGASAADLQLFLKLTDSVTSLLDGAGLRQSLQAPSDPREAENDAKALSDAFKRTIGARLHEEDRGIFRDRAGAIIDTADHPAGCRCVPCSWCRKHQEIVPASTVGNRIPEAPSESAIVRAPSPPAPRLRVVEAAPQPAPCPQVEPARLVGDLQDQRRRLTERCDNLRRQIGQLADRALTNADTKARRDRMQADLVLLESDLSRLNVTINQQQQSASQSTTAKFLEWSAGGGGRSSYDMSPGWDWPRLR